MPTIRIPGALLALSGPFHDAPWSWETWRSVTGLNSAPFAQNETEHLPPNWTPATTSAVRAFAERFWSLPENERIGFMTKRKDNDAVGRDAWCDLVIHGWNKGWKAHEIVTKLLVEHNVHPYMVMKRLNVKTVRLLGLAADTADTRTPTGAATRFGCSAGSCLLSRHC
jgi:hypothetical protein